MHVHRRVGFDAGHSGNFDGLLRPGLTEAFPAVELAHGASGLVVEREVQIQI